MYVQVLEVAAGQLVVGNDLDLAVALLGDLDGLAEVTDAAINLDLLVQELLKGRDVEDLVAGGLRGVDDELKTQSQQSASHCRRLGGAHLLRHLGALGLGGGLLLYKHMNLSLLFHAMIAQAKRC